MPGAPCKDMCKDGGQIQELRVNLLPARDDVFVPIDALLGAKGPCCCVLSFALLANRFYQGL